MQTLKGLRTSYGFTQEELANMFGVTSRTIQNMEKDSTNIRDSLLKKYMVAFDVSYDDIFLGKEYEIFEFYNKRKKIVLKRLQAEPV